MDPETRFRFESVSNIGMKNISVSRLLGEHDRSSVGVDYIACTNQEKLWTDAPPEPASWVGPWCMPLTRPETKFTIAAGTGK